MASYFCHLIFAADFNFQTLDIMSLSITLETVVTGLVNQHLCYYHNFKSCLLEMSGVILKMYSITLDITPTAVSSKMSGQTQTFMDYSQYLNTYALPLFQSLSRARKTHLYFHTQTDEYITYIFNQQS